MKRRDFLKYSAFGIAGILVGCGGGSNGGNGTGGDGGGVNPPDKTFNLSMAAALFEMIDGETVFMWSFTDPQGVPRMPGPVFEVTEGEVIRINVTNNLAENHAFAIPGVAESGVIAPGATAAVTFTAPAGGIYLYFDPLNAPVNRVLGLHGPLIVQPANGNTPYSINTPAVQQLFNDLGTTAHFPPHASYLTLANRGWQRDRFRIWLHNQVDPVFNAMAHRGETIDPAEMIATFLPRYFTINGKSGAFSGHADDIVLKGRIGQPMLVRILNAGLFTHSDHLHANHFYVVAENGVVRERAVSADTWIIEPEDRVDVLVPFIRPPDIPGDPNIPLRDLIPNELALVLGGVRQSPLVYPMHCHNEPSQTAAGGNYPQGAVTHIEFLGDIDGVDFPGVMEEESHAPLVLIPEGGLPVVSRGEMPPAERLAFHKHICPPAFGGANPDPVLPDRIVRRDLLVGIDLLLPDEARVPMWVLEDPDEPNNALRATFPAKTIRVVENEVVRCPVTCKGGTHTIHWHGIEPTPMNDGVGKHSFEVDGNFDYQFQAREPGTFFYHCHKNTVLHFEMGLYGLLIVDAKEPAGSPVTAPYRDGGPGFIHAFSPETGNVIAYDVEAFWVSDEIDSRWHALGHNAFMQRCDPDDPVNPANFSRDGFLHDFRPDIFLMTGIPRRFNDPTPFTAVENPIFGPLVAPTLRVGQTLIARILNAGYTTHQYTIGLDVLATAADGRAFGIPPFQQYSTPATFPAGFSGTALRFSVAERLNLIMRPTVAGIFPVTVDYFHSVSGKLLYTATTAITVLP